MMAEKPNEDASSNLQLGDRIEIKRGIYSHWALYAGDGKVIHMAGVGNETLQSGSQQAFTICGKLFDKAEVRIDDLLDVIKDSKAWINNRKDQSESSYSGREIISRAKKYLGRIEYNLISQNCEHFVNWCRYGEATSDQVKNIVGTAVALGALGAFALGGVALYKAQKTRKNKQ